MRRARLRRLHAAPRRDLPYLPAGERWATLASGQRSSCRRDRTLGRDSDDALARRSRTLPSARRELPDLVHVYFHDTDLLDRRRRTLAPASCCGCSRAERTSPTSTPSRPMLLAGRSSRHVGRRGAALSIHGVSGKAAPPAETSHPAPTQGASGRDVRASRLYVLSRGPILSVVTARALRRGARRPRRGIGLALGIYLALVLRQVVTGDGDVLWSLLWREGPAEWLKFAAPITVLVFAQCGPVPPARAAARRGSHRRLPHRRRPHRARLRARDRATTSRRPASSRRPSSPARGDDRAAPSRVRVRVARGHARGGNQPAGRPRRRGRELSCALTSFARCGAQRAHLRVRRRRRAGGRSRVPAARRRALSSRSCSTRCGPTR